MKRARLTITANKNYDVLVLKKNELLGKAGKATPTFRAYTNPQGSDISTLNDNIIILSETKCNIEKENLVFALSENRTGICLRLNNFSIKNLLGLGAEVTFETTGKYNYQEQFTISFNVPSEFLGLELSNPRIVYQGQRLQPNKAIESFDVKCVQKTSGLLDWQYRSCNYTLSIAEPFYFILDGGRKSNSQRLSSKLGFNTTLNVGLADISDSIVEEDLMPIITLDGNGTSSKHPLLSFRLVYLGLSIDEGQLVFNEAEFDVKKAIIAFNAKCKKDPEGLTDWRYLPCNYLLNVEKPFSFLTNTGVKDSIPVISDFGIDSTFKLCLSEIADSMVNKELLPSLTISNLHNTNANQTLLSFKLEYSGVEVSNIKAIKLKPIIGDTEAFESFDLSFKGRTKNLMQWQYLANKCELKLCQPFCFEESRSDSIAVKSLCGLFETLHVCLSSKTAPSYIGKELIPIVTISGKEINDEVELLHPVIIQPKPVPEIEVKFVPESSSFRITDITKDIIMGYLEITNNCKNPLGEDLVIKKIEPSNKCISIEKAVYSPINPGKSVKVTVLKYKSQAFMGLTEEPFSINCIINVTSNAGARDLRFTLVVTDSTPVWNQDEITIPITPLPQLNIGVSDQIICYDGEEKKEVDLCVSHWHDKPRKNVLLSLEDKKGVASLEKNSFPIITPNVDYKLQLLIDVSKLKLNKPTQVIVSAIADYTYKVSKSVTIIKNSKEVAKPKIENFYSENNFIYANGQEYKVSTFDIVNDTQSASEIEAESADITSLGIEIAEQEKIVYSPFFRIDRPKDLLKPQEKVKCTVLLKIKREKFYEDSVYFNYRPVCDNQINYEEVHNQTQSVTINRQLPVEKGMISFDPEQNNGYDPKDNSFFIGTIVLHEKKENPYPERFYDRIEECIGIVDKNFFFTNNEGKETDDIQTFGIEKKELRLYWRVLGRENLFLDIPLPIHYYCENVPEDNDKLISEIYE